MVFLMYGHAKRSHMTPALSPYLGQIVCNCFYLPSYRPVSSFSWTCSFLQHSFGPEITFHWSNPAISPFELVQVAWSLLHYIVASAHYSCCGFICRFSVLLRKFFLTFSTQVHRIWSRFAFHDPGRAFIPYRWSTCCFVQTCLHFSGIYS